MSSGSRWGAQLARVRSHAKSLHPNDPRAARRLESKLLGIITEEDVQEMRDRMAALQLPEAAPERRPWWKFLWLFGC